MSMRRVPFVLAMLALLASDAGAAVPLGPPAPYPDVRYGWGYEAARMFFGAPFSFRLAPGRWRHVDFEIPADVVRDVPCALGDVIFTWSVRAPYPAPAGAVGFFSAHQLSEQQFEKALRTAPAKGIGEYGASYCRDIVAVNRSNSTVLVEVRYIVAIRRT